MSFEPQNTEQGISKCYRHFCGSKFLVRYSKFQISLARSFALSVVLPDTSPQKSVITTIDLVGIKMLKAPFFWILFGV